MSQSCANVITEDHVADSATEIIVWPLQIFYLKTALVVMAGYNCGYEL